MDKGMVSVVIPTMNEEKSIGMVIEEVRKAVGQSRPMEVLVVDTDSKDHTREVAVENGARVIEEPRRGYGRAYKTGFENAAGEYIVTLDADMTYPASEIPALLELLESESFDFVSTNRFAKMERGAMSAKHKFGNWVLSATTRVLFRVKLKDSQSGMWAFKKGILKKLDLKSDGMSFSEELKIEAFRKVKSTVVPIPYGVRIGEAKISSWGDGFGNLKYLFKKRF